RQALEQSGRVKIDQEMIYDLMRKTADRFYDAPTDAIYLRLNIKRAVDQLLGDVEGHSKHTALDLGGMGVLKSAAGDFRFAGDRDFFTFKAGISGTLRITVECDDGLAFRWRKFLPNGKVRIVNGNTLT